jgi:hypothetical protein
MSLLKTKIASAELEEKIAVLYNVHKFINLAWALKFVRE